LDYANAGPNSVRKRKRLSELGRWRRRQVKEGGGPIAGPELNENWHSALIAACHHESGHAVANEYGNVATYLRRGFERARPDLADGIR